MDPLQHYAVIGYPLGYSLSPLLHNTFFEKEGIAADYTSVPLAPQELSFWVKGRTFAGFNVTVPYKESIVSFLDDHSHRTVVRKIGAVNTVKNINGKLLGTNTDAPGFTMMLKEELNLSMEGLNILVLGAGGASRAIVYAAGEAGVKQINVYDTDTEKCHLLSLNFSELPMTVIESDLKTVLPRIDLVVNATPVGMEATLDMSILSEEDLALLNPNTPVVDIIYVPAETKLLRLARERGLPTCNGLGMLVGQGILAQSFWFGKQLDYVYAKSILLRGL
ncbi:MAG: shikimate dehydrogenase [Candidatus Margulisiibacteriota bacterium]